MIKLPNYLLENIKKFINKNSLIYRGDTVLIGVSGGADSVALLFLLNQLKHELGINIVTAHFNHNLRRTSYLDQLFVKKLSDKLRLKFFTEELKNKYSKSFGSLENYAREKRFEFLIKTAKQTRADSIALAHTKNDLAETVIMKVIRGSGLNGLRSILPKRDINNTKFIRPLLEIEKNELIKFLKLNKISFREDLSNKKDIYFRNKIRHNLMPILKKEYNIGIEKTLSNLANIAAIDYEYINLQGQKAFNKTAFLNKRKIIINLKAFNNYHDSLKRTIIRLSLEKLLGDTNTITLKHMLEIEDLISNRLINSKVNLPKGIICTKKPDNLIIFSN
ncbi:tRNA(Ile)-lysidine synthetase [sediment metagenome]|uniref:tRNA(Ile)-lysidine synthetase n=1 Tax=sediment metagenome TaxID=749907 RepID=D9PEZ4_9ZZZZ